MKEHQKDDKANMKPKKDGKETHKSGTAIQEAFAKAKTT